jgi:hypothetical protein
MGYNKGQDYNRRSAKSSRHVYAKYSIARCLRIYRTNCHLSIVLFFAFHVLKNTLYEIYL